MTRILVIFILMLANPLAVTALNKPLVIKKSGSNFEINKRFKHNLEAILRFNDLSYRLVKGHVEQSETILNKYLSKGWEIKPFTGLSGKDLSHDDLMGFIAFNPRKKFMVVVYHGSQDSHDWGINFDIARTTADAVNDEVSAALGVTTTLNIPGTFHKGFAKKYLTSQQNVIDIMDTFIEKMPEEDIDDLIIVVTGHSQGAALAQVAVADLAGNFGEQLFGEGFRNKDDNNFFGYFISAPRVFDNKKKSWKWATKKIGRHNMIRQNVQGDLVTIGPLSKEHGDILKKIPIFGKDLANNMRVLKESVTLRLIP
jgi:lipase (class 3)